MKVCAFRGVGEPPGVRRLGAVGETGVREFREDLDMLEYLSRGGRATLGDRVHPLDGVIMGAPIIRPGKIVAAIVNTQAMLGGGDVVLDRPRLDMKAPSAVVGPGETILAPQSGIRPEVELAAVIGRRATQVTTEGAGGCIFGYTILNDVTAPADSRDDAYEAYRRDRKTGEIRRVPLRGPLFRSKNHDTFCPMGPWIVSSDELGSTSSLKMSTSFGGAKVQDGSTSEYIFTPQAIVAYVSGFLTLEPGDVVSCGSVGWSPEALGNLDPTEYLLPERRGMLELEIQGIGRLANPVAPA